jgi:hypothetical protein
MRAESDGRLSPDPGFWTSIFSGRISTETRSPERTGPVAATMV